MMDRRKPIRFRKRVRREILKATRRIKRAAGPEKGSKLANAFLEAFGLIARFPQIGKHRPEFGVPRLHTYLAEHHVIFYQDLSDRILVLRIIHEGRDPNEQFRAWVRRNPHFSGGHPD
jgi:plasmid stabilization system protein ParE